MDVDRIETITWGNKREIVSFYKYICKYVVYFQSGLMKQLYGPFYYLLYMADRAQQKITKIEHNSEGQNSD